MNTNPFTALPPVVKNLLIINALLLLISYVSQNALGINLSSILGLHHYQSSQFEPYQIVTHMFMHGDIFHLFFNMFALYMFGRVLEMVWGGKRFLIYYLITGLGAATLYSVVNAWEVSGFLHDAQAFLNTPNPELFGQFLAEHLPQLQTANIEFIDEWKYNPDNLKYAQEAESFVLSIMDKRLNVPMVGASGAVYGVLLAFGMLFPNTELMLLFPPIPIKAKYMVMVYGAIELYLGFSNNPDDNVAHFAHLGGMLFGVILIKMWQKNRFQRF
ncbi:MAG TPA: DUF1751 domain-containing protein [Bacteroidales bacterium]|nr:DUF1751 domain-containing protein [Bacteroidales bacterium]